MCNYVANIIQDRVVKRLLLKKTVKYHSIANAVNNVVTLLLQN